MRCGRCSAFLLAGCNQTQATSAIDKLAPCKGDDTPVDAYCGTLKVYENRETKQGRQIDLNIVLLPALSADPKPDPFFFLAGGPGQGAAKMAKPLREAFRQMLTDRDIVLVDQRGTGKSNPLNCVDPDESLKSFNEPEEASIAKLKQCMSGYDADLRLYTTPIAMDDLDDVRAYLGYDTINIYGGSYGTRAGLVYMRQHGDRVRTAVLDGVAPTNMRLPLFFPRDVQRAFDRLIADCATDAGCNARYPNLGARARALVERLEKTPPLVSVVHPRTGEHGEIRMTARILVNVFAQTLYQPLSASLLPALIERAEQNDFQGVLALTGGGGDPEDPMMAVGMQLSVICAEDAPRISAEEAKHEADGTLFGPHVMRHAARGLRVLAARQRRRVFLRAGAVLHPDINPVGRDRSGHAAGVGRGHRQDPAQLEAHRDARHRAHRRRHRVRTTLDQGVHRCRHGGEP